MVEHIILGGGRVVLTVGVSHPEHEVESSRPQRVESSCGRIVWNPKRGPPTAIIFILFCFSAFIGTSYKWYSDGS